MLNTFICGSFDSSEELDALKWSSSPCSSPRKSRKNNKDSKNPYSSRGLDKFSALLAELDEKRQKVYSKMHSHGDVSLVRFVYTNSNDIVPIVVKLKDHQHLHQQKQKITGSTDHHHHHTSTTQNLQVIDKLPVEASAAAAVADKDAKEATKEKEKKKGSTWSKLMNLPSWRQPSRYMPVAIILILLFLAVFGRSAAILCTSIAWYTVPSLSLKPKKNKQTKKKEYARSLTHTPGKGASKENWAQQSEHRKSF
ncbi:hypothetical protein Tsubulata_031131 [Turnera subulata]|uniref:ZCF37 n=1 Tax=Turnera subulata TaxID=218843 RepID=A0A9Q0FYH4_9ROSI|nr:hypothetical protein Tsubulata_031131 [Turnera subulata]